MDKNKKIDTLLSLYNIVISDITFYQNQGDSTNIKDVIPIAIIPMLDLFDVNTFIISMVCLFVPVIQCLSLQRGLQAHKFVAMLRGYAASIEDSINEILHEKHFIYNSVLIDKYIASDKVVKSNGKKTSWVVTVLIHYAILAVCLSFYVYFNLGKPWWNFALAGLWFAFLLVFISILCKKFSKKEIDRYTCKSLANNIVKKSRNHTYRKIKLRKIRHFNR